GAETTASSSKLFARKVSPVIEGSDSDSGDENPGLSSSSNTGGSYIGGDVEEGDGDDVDAPRVAQWVDEDELDLEDENESPQIEKPLKLVESDESENEGELPEVVDLKGQEKEKIEWSLEPRKDIAKRSNKHAPIEVTSKRPVTRKRTVVEVKAAQARDPRFLPLAGEFSAEKFQKSYGFLAESHKKELDTLRENLKRARRVLVSSPRDTYEERAEEVHRLELAVKRAESQVNKDRREKVEQEALAKVSKEERERRKQGKGEWHLKTSKIRSINLVRLDTNTTTTAQKREILTKARYEALDADGGKRAVKKVMEKRQKKIGQKEKKSRPRPPSEGGDRKRRRVG
ncbi:hypothetical protein H0H81_001562, partial [Sphagnurus paluster]